MQGWLILSCLVILAVPAAATIIDTRGAGSAVDTVHRSALFDAVQTGTDLTNYTEDFLRIAVPSMAFVDFDPSQGNGGFSGGFHFPNNGSTQYTSITTTENNEFEAIEMNIGTGFQVLEAHVYYEVWDEGILIGSGAFSVAPGAVIGFESNMGGFDELRLGAYFSLAIAQNPNGATQAAALDNVHVELIDPPTTVIPEPASMAMFGTGLLSLIGYGWFRRKMGMSTEIVKA